MKQFNKIVTAALFAAMFGGNASAIKFKDVITEVRGAGNKVTLKAIAKKYKIRE